MKAFETRPENEGESDVQATLVWRAKWLSLPTFLYLVFLGAGILVLVIAISGHSGERNSGGFLIFAIVWCLLAWGEALPFLVLPMRKAVKLADGTVVFSRGSRQLLIMPGELKSVSCIWLDPNRLLPMLLRCERGWAFLAPRFQDMEGLFRVLERQSPGVRITNPKPLWFRSSASSR